MNPICAPNNTYFFRKNTQIEAKHQFAFVRGFDFPEDAPDDKVRLYAIGVKLIDFNNRTKKSGLKILSDMVTIERKQKVKSSGRKPVQIGINCMIVVSVTLTVYFFCFWNFFKNTSPDEVQTGSNVTLLGRNIIMQEKVRSESLTDNDLVSNLVFMTLTAIFVGGSYGVYELVSAAYRPLDRSSPKDDVSCRYWKVIKLETIPSHGMEVFEESMSENRVEDHLLARVFPFSFCGSTLPHPTVNRNMTRSEAAAFKAHLSNLYEDDSPLDPISYDPVPGRSIWTSKVVVVRKCVVKTDMLLKRMWEGDKGPNGEIYHPLWAEILNTGEHERLYNHFAAVMGVDRRTIVECWNIDDSKVTEWTFEDLDKESPGWRDSSEEVCARIFEDKKRSLRQRYPIISINMLPTYKVALKNLKA